MTKRPLALTAIAFATLTVTTLTGCLVKQETPPPPYYRTTDEMRIYQQGDWIRYNVIATITNSSGIEQLNGTMEVKWQENLAITSPDNKNYNVIKKVITVNTDNNGVTDSVTTVHYVLDTDPNKLVAMGHPNLGQYYWLNTKGGISGDVDGVLGGQEPVTLLTSPLVIGHTDNIDYTLMDDCTTGNPGCLLNVGQFTNTVTVVGDSTPVNTNINNYANPFEVSFDGTLLPATNITSLPLKFDIFDVCSDTQSSHNGRMFIVPEVGIIQMSNQCTDLGGNGDIVYYEITIDSINIQ